MLLLCYLSLEDGPGQSQIEEVCQWPLPQRG